MMNNLAQQIEELEVLNSIFGKQWEQCEDVPSTYSIKLAKDVQLWITLNESYPSAKPPQYELWAPNLTKPQKDFVDRKFNELYMAQKGYPVIFAWIESLKEVISGKTLISNGKTMNENQQQSEKSPMQTDTNNSVTKFKLDIIHGPVITDRKSTFQGHTCKVTHPEQINHMLEELCKNRKIREAKHNIVAYRIATDKNAILQDCDDDGENHAGGRLLHLLQILDVRNVAVVVTRWFGGTLLGPDRFKHINNAGRQALLEAGFIK